MATEPKAAPDLFAQINRPGDMANLTDLDFTARTTCPILKACVSLPKDLGPRRVFARCNLHGVWEADRPLTVR